MFEYGCTDFLIMNKFHFPCSLPFKFLWIERERERSYNHSRLEEENDRFHSRRSHITPGRRGERVNGIGMTTIKWLFCRSSKDHQIDRIRKERNDKKRERKKEIEEKLREERKSLKVKTCIIYCAHSLLKKSFPFHGIKKCLQERVFENFFLT